MPNYNNLQVGITIATYTGNTEFYQIFNEKKYDDFADFAGEVLLFLRDKEKENQLKEFCKKLLVWFKKFRNLKFPELENFLATINGIILQKSPLVKSYIPLTESMGPFLMELSRYLNINHAVKSHAIENDKDHYVISYERELTIRYDEDGEIYDSIVKSPKCEEDGQHRITPEINRNLERLMSTPTGFIPIDPDETDLEILGGGVKKPPASPVTVEPGSYSEIAKRYTPTPVHPSMSPIPELDSPKKEVKIPDNMVYGKLYITKNKTGNGMAFINLLTMNGEKIFHEKNGNKIEMKTIFCSRFENLDHYKGHKVRVPFDYLQVNRNNEIQFYPVTGFMHNLEVETDGEWKPILS